MQKLTLTDYPGIMACIVFTVGCNFKCPFCHNALLVNGSGTDYIDEDTVLDFLKKRKGILDGVVITGGEPLLNSDIACFLEKIKQLGYLIKLDTNGTNPLLLKRLVKDGLVDYVAMDIKSSPDNYKKATGDVKLDFDAIKESMNFLLESDINYEFRTTVVKGIHTKEDLISLSKQIPNAKNYYLQQYKSSPDNLAPSGLSEFSKEEMEDFIQTTLPIVKTVKLRGL